MQNSAVLLAALVFPATLLGCGKSNAPTAAASTNNLCRAIIDAGVTNHCVVSNQDNTIGIVADTSDVAAMSLCMDIATKLKPLTGELSNRWKVQIFSPYRPDKPIGSCPIH